MFWWLQRRLILSGIERSIRKNGWTATYVPAEDEVGALAYTTGFQDAVGAPEVVTFGATMEDANGIFHTIFNALKAGDLVQTDGGVWDAPWGPVPRVVWRRVHPSQIRREYFNIAIVHAERVGRRRDDIQAWQLVFADAQGHMPWEAAFDRNTLPRQPALYEPYSGPPDD